MSSETDHVNVQKEQQIQRGLHIVVSNVGLDRWHTLWDRLLAPDPPAEPAAKALHPAKNRNRRSKSH